MSGSISTVAIHADRDIHPSHAVAPPIYQTATFWAEDAEQFARAAVDRRGQDFYTRYGNPNHAQVAAVVADLEHTEAAMVTASGMAALTTAVLALVSAGDHVIGQKSTYGGTASVLLNLLPRLGVRTTQVDQAEGRPGGVRKRADPADPPDSAGIAEQSAVADHRPARRRGPGPRAQRADHGRQHLRHSGEPATDRPRGRSGLAQRDQVPQRPFRRVRRGAGRTGGDPGPDLGCRPSHRCRTRPVRRVAAAAWPAHPAAAHATAQRQRAGARGGAERPSGRGPGALSRPGDPPAARAGAQPDERFRRGTRHRTRRRFRGCDAFTTRSSPGCATSAGRPASAAWIPWPYIRRPCGAAC